MPPVASHRPAVAVPRIALVAAIAANGVIGAQGRLPWHLPEDLRHFKRTTLGHPVIMGRRTWESIGRALPGRRNIVVTSRADFNAPGAERAPGLDAALRLFGASERVFVIGGAALYAEALPLADTLYLTELHAAFEGDTTFPDFDRAQWRETERTRERSASGLKFDFVRYERRDATRG